MIARDRGDNASATESLEQALLSLDEERDPTVGSISHYQLAYVVAATRLKVQCGATA
jgi:hypothetical protein